MAKDQIFEGIVLDDSITYTLAELAHICALEEKLLIDMVEHGVTDPISGQEPAIWVFTSRAVIRVKKAVRLQQDFDLNWQGVSLALQLLDEIEELRQAVSLLKNE